MLKIPSLKGWVKVHNFGPNNWEGKVRGHKFVHAIWLGNSEWESKCIGRIAFGESMLVQDEEINLKPSASNLLIFTLSDNILPAHSNVLPASNDLVFHTPAWRATLGLSSSTFSSSYQGEIDAFHPKGSLLSFAPFIQASKDCELRNYLLLINIESNPIQRICELNIYNSSGNELLQTASISSNCANIILLDNHLPRDDLVIISCREMSGIPVFISHSIDGNYISIEHTHPPASFAIHGDRWRFQKYIKERWFEKIDQLNQ